MFAWQTISYSLLLLLVALVLTALALSAWQRRPAPGASLFVLFLMSVALWSVAYSFEIGLAALPLKIFWAKLKYLGIVLVPIGWLGFVLQYIGQGWWLTRSRLMLLLFIPFLTLLLVWSTELHGLIWVPPITVSQVGSAASTLQMESGVWFWVHTAYSYLLFLLGTILFVGKILRSSALYRWQGLTLILGALIPWVLNIIYLSGSSSSSLDLTPFAFALGAVAVGWSLFYFRLLDIVPVARGALVEKMQEGVLVLDYLGRIVDLNPAAEEMMGLPPAALIGRELMEVRALEALMRSEATAELHSEITIERAGEPYHFDLHTSPLYDQRGRFTGRLVVLHDVTERKRAEAALAESEERFRKLTDATFEGIVIHEEGLILEANEAIAGMFRYGLPELIGRHVLQFIAPESKETVRRNMLTGYEEPYEAIGVKKDGTRFHIEIRGKALPYRGLTVRVAATRDITPYKEAERERERLIHQLQGALSRTEALYRAAHSLIGLDSLATMLQTVVDNAASALSAHQLLLLTFDAKSGQVRLVIEGGPGAEQIDKALCQVRLEEVPQRIGTDPYRLAIPLHFQDQILGLIYALNPTSAPPFTQDDRDLLETLASQAAIAIENARLFEEVEWQATRDGLTGVYTRRHFFELGEKSLQHARHAGQPVCAIMLDIDHFKRINDTYGHAAGDQVLQLVAASCLRRIRSSDILGRYGGEEFALLLPDTDLEAVRHIAERLRQHLAQLAPLVEGERIKITASFGVAPLCEDMGDLSALLNAADQALYQAKASGRNRVVVRECAP